MKNSTTNNQGNDVEEIVEMENNYSNSKSTSMSDDVRQIAQAFLGAKRSFDKTGRSSKGNFGKYATLSDIYGAVEGALMDNNIIITHFADYLAEGIEILHTRLIHTLSGQFIHDTRILYSEKPGNQAKGSANTYMKKYAVLSLCAIAAEDDDDGQEEQNYIERHGSKKRYSSSAEYINEEQVAHLTAKLQESGKAKTLFDRICSFNKVTKLSELTLEQYRGALISLEKSKSE